MVGALAELISYQIDDAVKKLQSVSRRDEHQMGIGICFWSKSRIPKKIGKNLLRKSRWIRIPMICFFVGNLIFPLILIWPPFARLKTKVNYVHFSKVGKQAVRIFIFFFRKIPFCVHPYRGEQKFLPAPFLPFTSFSAVSFSLWSHLTFLLKSKVC